MLKAYLIAHIVRPSGVSKSRFTFVGILHYVGENQELVGGAHVSLLRRFRDRFKLIAVFDEVFERNLALLDLGALVDLVALDVAEHRRYRRSA